MSAGKIADLDVCVWFKCHYLPSGVLEAVVCHLAQGQTLSSPPLVTHTGKACRVVLESRGRKTLLTLSKRSPKADFVLLAVASNDVAQLRLAIRVVQVRRKHVFRII